MGILTGFRAVDSDLFARVRKRKQMKILLDVLNGWDDEIAKLNLPPNMQFPHQYLDKGWDDIEYLFNALYPSIYDYRNANYRANLKAIDYGSIYAFYWTTRQALTILQNHYHHCRLHLPDETFETFVQTYGKSKRTLISHQDLSTSMAKLEEKIQTIVLEKAVRSDLFQSNYDMDTAEYVFSHYQGYIEFMMKALYPTGLTQPQERVIIGMQS